MLGLISFEVSQHRQGWLWAIKRTMPNGMTSTAADKVTDGLPGFCASAAEAFQEAVAHQLTYGPRLTLRPVQHPAHATYYIDA